MQGTFREGQGEIPAFFACLDFPFSAEPQQRTSAATAAFAAAVAARLLPCNPAVDDGAGTADSGLDPDGGHRAVAGAGAAFHAAVAVDDPGLFLIWGKNGMRAHDLAHPAADASFPIQLEGGDPFQVSHLFHLFLMLWPS